MRTLFHRADTLVTENSDRQRERVHVRKALANNGYPDWMFGTPSPSRHKPSSEIRVGIPYIRGTSERLARTFRDHGVDVFHKPTGSLRSRLTHVKDVTNKGKKCGTVYYIQCSNCNEDYIGETERLLQTRLKEHQSRSSSEAFHEHLLARNHSIDIDQTVVLDQEAHTLKRKVKEAIEIKTRRPSLNRDSGLELSPIYNSILPSLVQAPVTHN